MLTDRPINDLGSTSRTNQISHLLQPLHLLSFYLLFEPLGFLQVTSQLTDFLALSHIIAAVRDVFSFSKF